MPGTNLTREEAQTRARLLAVESYTIDLDLTTSETTFGSTTTIRFTCSEPGADTFVDLVGATVHEITLNGTSVDPETAYADSRIALSGLAADNELVVRADCTYSRSGEGLHRFVDPADDRVYLYSQFEVPDARRVFTTFEQPDLKSTYTFNVTAPAHWKVVSNAPTPEPRETGDGVAVWNFPATKRMSTYITALVAGEYYEVLDTYEGKNGEIPLGHYCRQSLVEHLDREELVKLTKQGFEYFEEAFGFPYPFEKYDQLYVPEYNMGAMENAGCVTLRDEYLPRSRQDRSFYEFRCSVILHEMAHMWFGDLVTMRWWDDLWLNESFAEWACYHAAVEATEFDESWTGFTNARKNWAYRQDQLPSTHPVAADNYDLQAVEVNFDGITYAKGASILKQLVAWVGLENFLAGLGEYFHDHAYDSAEFSDLLGALEKSSGRELSDWAHEWLQTSGVNTLHAEFTLDDDGSYASFAVAQTAAPDYPTLRRHRIGIGMYDEVDGRLVRRSTRRGRHPRREHRDRRAGRPAAARPAAAQRRRPDLRQDPPRRALAGHGRRRPGPARRLAGPGAVLGRGVGHDPRRRDERLRLRRPGAGQHRHRDRRVRRQPDPRLRRPGGQQLLRARPTGRRSRQTWEQGLRKLLENARAGQRPPAVLRPRVRRRRALRPGARRARRACSTGSPTLRGPGGRHRPALDAAARRSPAPAAPTARGSTPSWPATTPSPARSAPPRPAPPAPPPRPRPRPGSRRWCATTYPTRRTAAWSSPSRRRARTRC